MREVLKKLCKYTILKPLKLSSFLYSDATIGFLNKIREFELKRAFSYFPAKGRVLEVGAGAGWQAKSISEKGYDVEAVEVAGNHLKDEVMWSIKMYDGYNLPFKDNSFDVVFSSNVLEHISRVEQFQEEIHRVLKPDGVAIHLMPSAVWRFWSIITIICKNQVSVPRHGEHSKNVICEIWDFRRGRWKKFFKKTGWEVKAGTSNRIFYTSASMWDSKLSIKWRRRISFLLGGSCNLFVLTHNNKKVI